MGESVVCETVSPRLSILFIRTSAVLSAAPAAVVPLPGFQCWNLLCHEG